MNSTKSLIFDLMKSLIFDFAQTFSSDIQFDCKGYTLSGTFYRIEIELLVFKLCPVLFGKSFSKLSFGCSSE